MRVARTAEQQARYNILRAAASTRLFNPEELEEYQRLGELAPWMDTLIADPTRLGVYQTVTAVPVPATGINEAPLTPVPPKTRIHVKVAPHPEYGRGAWVIVVKVNDEDQELPDKEVIRGFLPQGEKSKLARGRRYRGTHNALRDALNAGLSPQSLHDALKAWAVAANTLSTAESNSTIDDETAHLLHAQPATLEVGGKVFKLVPAGEIDVRPLIHRVRTKALAGAKAEAVTITNKAKTDARLVVHSAEQSAQAVRLEVAQMQRELSSQVPNWVKASGRGVRWAGDRWWVQLGVQCRIKEIRWTVAQWNTIFYWNPLNHPVTMRDEDRAYYYETHVMPLWVRLNPEGKFTLDDVRHFDQFTTVHTAASRTCMSLQMMPPALLRNADLIALEKCISRGLQVVNLNSPLDRGYEYFWPDFRAQVPPVVVKWLRGNISLFPARTGQTLSSYQDANPSVTWDRSESIEQEGAGVFSTENYQPTGPIPIDPAAEVTIQEVLEEAQRATRR